MFERLASLPGIDLMEPAGRALDRLHRPRRALSAEQEQELADLPPLPAPWDQDPRWYKSDFPPRQHNRLTPLPHGASYFTDLYGELMSARERVTIAGWALSPFMPLVRGDEEEGSVFSRVMADVSRQAEVYVLLWAGAPALFQPNTRGVEEVRERLLAAAPSLHCELDRTAPFSHDHHQKAVTIDGRVAYVGGMDISTFQGDRWDTADHPIRSGVGWHDVQIRLEGEVVADVEANFCQRWNGAVGDKLRPLAVTEQGPAGTKDERSTEKKSVAASSGRQSFETPAQIVRTIPKDVYPSMSRGHFGIRHALLQAIAGASEYIYLENQYLWAPEIVEALCEAIDRNKGGDFRVLIVLPASAYDGRYDNDDRVREVCRHDGGRGIFSAYSIYGAGPGEGPSGYRYVPVYVHAKVAIVDDSWLLVGSANLNRRGLATDSEIAVQAPCPELARALRLRLWSEHLGMDESEIAERPAREIVDGPWKERAREMERRRRESEPPPAWHVHPYSLRATPTSRLKDRFQALTLEH